MFVRVKPSGPRKYLQVVENHREGRKTRQKVVCTLGRLDRLEAQGDLDSLAKSLARFSNQVRIVEGHRSGRLRAGRVVKTGPAIVTGRLWRDLGIGRVIEDGLRDRKFMFSVERAVFLTVLHRLFAQGSDRAAEKWKREGGRKGRSLPDVAGLPAGSCCVAESSRRGEQDLRSGAGRAGRGRRGKAGGVLRIPGTPWKAGAAAISRLGA